MLDDGRLVVEAIRMYFYIYLENVEFKHLDLPNLLRDHILY